MSRINTPLYIANVATGLIAIAIVFLTLTPVMAPDIIGQGSDKLYHVIAFAALTFPMAFLHPRGSNAVLACAILLGGAIEIIQPSVGRTGSSWDFVADVFGAFLGLVAGRILGRLFFVPKHNGS